MMSIYFRADLELKHRQMEIIKIFEEILVASLH